VRKEGYGAIVRDVGRESAERMVEDADFESLAKVDCTGTYEVTTLTSVHILFRVLPRLADTGYICLAQPTAVMRYFAH
jgi:hypothetical protein